MIRPPLRVAHTGAIIRKTPLGRACLRPNGHILKGI